ncbi:SAM-dependent methyltransferase [Actinoplanes sp. URMC 104]|uniref:SAM-dependent methyltransferase n=1 Tax=Actinoplanes sp. URMC 104 TaxID=3423409 RepID=UPI003F1D96F3
MTSASPDAGAPKLDTTVPHSARVWNYWLGGKDNYAVDREVGDSVLQVFPAIAENARACRAFIGRTVSYLAVEAGIRQFLDIGTGLPTADNTHEVAQRLAPESRIVYVDNDPLVLVHARALLSSGPEGATDFIDADLRDTATIRREAARTLDFGKPIALMLMGILGHVESDDEAQGIVKSLLDLLPSGSYLAFYDGTDTSEKIVEGARISSEGGHTYHLRSPERISRFFDGLELVDPGVVSVSHWRPGADGEPTHQDSYGGVARKP